MASYAELARFLADIERRAYKHALFALRDDHAALDVVQDAMLKLTEKYGDKPAEELPPLFQRILQNTLRDHYRRLKVRSLWSPLSALSGRDDEEDGDPLETLCTDDHAAQLPGPATELEQTQLIALIEAALKDLPPRQREAFLLRYWEDLDTAATAAAMGCSEGSVKTHCSRATHALAAVLKAKGIDLS